MLQIGKEMYLRVQPTELHKMRPEPKKERTLGTIQNKLLYYVASISIHMKSLPDAQGLNKEIFYV